MRKVLDLLCNYGYSQVARYALPTGHRRIYFYHIPKTAGTSLRHMFISAAQEDFEARRYGHKPTRKSHSIWTGQSRYWPQLVNGLLPRAPGGDIEIHAEHVIAAFRHRLSVGGLVFQFVNKRLMERGDYFFSASHIPAHALRLPPDTFTFTVLRHPLDRILSYYRMLLSQKANVASGAWKPTAWEYNAMLGSFDDFLEQIPREMLLGQIHHFSPTFDGKEAYEAIRNCSAWLLQERLESDISHLSAQIGLRLVPAWKNKSTAQPCISERGIDKLKSMLEPEIDLYNQILACRPGCH